MSAFSAAGEHSSIKTLRALMGFGHWPELYFALPWQTSEWWSFCSLQRLLFPIYSHILAGCKNNNFTSILTNITFRRLFKTLLTHILWMLEPVITGNLAFLFGIQIWDESLCVCVLGLSKMLSEAGACFSGWLSHCRFFSFLLSAGNGRLQEQISNNQKSTRHPAQSDGVRRVAIATINDSQPEYSRYCQTFKKNHTAWSVMLHYVLYENTCIDGSYITQKIFPFLNIFLWFQDNILHCLMFVVSVVKFCFSILL